MTAELEAVGCEGEGLSSPFSVTGFNGSANCGIRVLSSRFICSKPSLQTNGLDQVTLLPLPPVLCSSEKSMGQHKTGSSGIPCSHALKSLAFSVVARLQGLNQPRTCPCCPDPCPAAARDLSHLLSLSFFKFIYCVCARSLLLREGFL